MDLNKLELRMNETNCKHSDVELLAIIPWDSNTNKEYFACLDIRENQSSAGLRTSNMKDSPVFKLSLKSLIKLRDDLNKFFETDYVTPNQDYGKYIQIDEFNCIDCLKAYVKSKLMITYK